MHSFFFDSQWSQNCHYFWELKMADFQKPQRASSNHWDISPTRDEYQKCLKPPPSQCWSPSRSSSKSEPWPACVGVFLMSVPERRHGMTVATVEPIPGRWPQSRSDVQVASFTPTKYHLRLKGFVDIWHCHPNKAKTKKTAENPS